MIFNWKIVIIIIIALVVADKALTLANIYSVKKNFPEVDNLKIERNPIAKFFFEKFGLIGGVIIHSIITIVGVIIFLIFFANFFSSINVNNPLSISLYVFMIIYGVILSNNLFFLLKFSKVIS